MEKQSLFAAVAESSSSTGGGEFQREFSSMKGRTF